MPLQNAQAILLRRQPIRETSIILTFYTRDFGKIKGIVRGVRGPRAQGAGGGAYEPFALDDIVFYERRTREIYTISHCDLADYFAGLRSSLAALGHATYLIELLDAVTELSDPHPEVYDLALGSLRSMASGADLRRAARVFEIKLLSSLGIMPRLGSCARCGETAEPAVRLSPRDGGLVCGRCGVGDASAAPIMPGTARFIDSIQTLPADRIDRVTVSEDVARDLERALRRFLDFHIDRKLKTLSFLAHIERL